MLKNTLASKFRKIALPMALLQGVEVLAFSAVVFMAGWFGSDALAAHHATYTIMNLVYMSAIGVAGATSIRVGIAVGSQNVRDTKIAGIMGYDSCVYNHIPSHFIHNLLSRINSRDIFSRR